MADPGIDAVFGRSFAEQVAFFRQKTNLPSERWDDIWKEAHDHGFIVAGAAKADLLADLRGAVDAAIAKGTGLAQFRKDFDAIVARHGWTGWTGEGSQGGVAWRTRVIWQTNISTSYAAGRWQQLTDPEFLQFRPYWRYHHADGLLYPRPLHVAWNGRVLPHDHPFWSTHFPPNGWGCHCWVSSASEKDYQAAVAAGRAEPPAGWDEISDKTGAPVGIDKGFDYAPGKSIADELRAQIAGKTIPQPIKAALDKHLATPPPLVPAVSTPAVQPKTVSEFIQAGRDITATLPDGSGDPRACFDALTALLDREVGISTPCKVISSGEGARLVKAASQRFPDSWTAAADAFGDLRTHAISKGRASYVPGVANAGTITVRKGDVGCAVHEFAHRLQAALPELDQLFQDLHRQRTAGDPLESLRTLCPSAGFGPHEVTRKDKYVNAYQGREYRQFPQAPALEVMTMGVEDVLGMTPGHWTYGSRLARFIKVYTEDREMFDFVVGLLRWWTP